MAENDGRDAEMDALLTVEGIDTASISEQISKGRGKKDHVVPPPTTPPNQKSQIPPVTPPVPPADNKNVPDTETIRTGMLNEMFGDQFKTVDDVKKANIPASLQELVTLRQRTQELETQLKTKPKYHYANDNIAKFDEFVRSTGIEDASIFKKIDATDVANMSDMDALVMQHIIENPSLAGKEPQVRRYFETKYGVDSSKIDPKKVESGDMTEEELEQNKLQYETNLIGVTSDGNKAKAKLQELKGKIKMPEVTADEPGKSKWTPEIVTKQKEGWATINGRMLDTFSALPITPKGWKDPIANFVLPEETKKSVLQNALDYVISNQMEVSNENVESVANAMYSDIIFENRDEIYLLIAEKARSMTEQEFLKAYHNPSSKNTDNAPGKGELTSAEITRDKAYKLELGQ